MELFPLQALLDKKAEPIGTRVDLLQHLFWATWVELIQFNVIM
jgi:hypothetical protein